ncbi:hypothetical protein ITJ43_06430 [Microbacterium sp. VKM Ac-2870]|uniref:type IV toxin-antitoxin system AbiEi family antitoxin domain-containing protein n=1 Tax=Microbacterium sp. VKM Ac-2870 TaxID=2783825 RepID=UPI00188C6882|nr:type IV toxin-antitoxin system AbiEi family antitoxin domain-containing protein [Microbacterium sp. VKM Ac-2870]MBF4561773.1 hypothetical protein [Microbacterium sp. VKM Ac-2870]
MKAIPPRATTQDGLSRSAFYRAASEGRYERIGRGIYLPADAEASDWDWIEAASRRPESTICLMSALAHHDLTDAVPTALDVAIPRGSRLPATAAAIAWHSFDRSTFELGRDQVSIPGTDLTIGLYSAERSIADAFRLRGDLGYELARDALREWLRRGGKAADLIEMATRLPRAKRPIMQALDYLT